jgi:hypothetical protein
MSHTSYDKYKEMKEFERKAKYYSHSPTLSQKYKQKAKIAELESELHRKKEEEDYERGWHHNSGE